MPLNPNAIELKDYDFGGSFLAGLEKGQAQAKSNALAAKVANRGKTPISDIYAQEGMGDESLKAAESEAQTAKDQAATTGLGLKNKEDMLNIGMKASQEMLASPNLSKETVKQTFDKYFNMGLTDRNIYQQQLQSLGTLPDDPEALRQHIMGNVQAAMSAKDAMAQTAPDANALLSDQRAAAGQALTARGQDIGQQQFGQAYGLNERKFNEDVGQNEFERANKAAQYNLSARELDMKKQTAASPISQQQRQADADAVLSILDQAGPLLEGSTHSLVGTAYDKAAGAVGVGTEGGNKAAQLRALEGALISKMPKMSGPQSDKDVLLYKQMAGQIGDSSLPISTRKAAMETIRGLNNQYASEPRKQRGASDSWGGLAEKHGITPEQHAAILKAMGGQ